MAFRNGCEEGTMKQKQAISKWAVAALMATVAFGFAGCKQSASTKGSSATDTAALDAGKPSAPDVTFTQLQGGDLPLASLKGKVVLVNFWATWCDPCRGEIPLLIAAQNKYASRGFTILGVAMDEEGKKVVQPFVQNTKFDVDGSQETMSYPIVIGNEDLAEKFGGLIGYPTSVLISRSGKIVERFVGAISKGELQKDIEEQLQAPTPPQSNRHS
jgi:thiol-disulfide isomerase/thioredoxin